MEPNDESLGGAFGLGRVLADSGIDTAAFSSLYSKTSGEAAGPSTSAFDDVDAASEKHAAYEDDVSDSELPAESVEEIRAREARKAEEERWYQRAVTMQAQAESSRGQEERERKKKERERDDTAKVKNLWPEFVQGKRLKLSEVFYETPRMKTAWAKELERKRRRKLDKIECVWPLSVEYFGERADCVDQIRSKLHRGQTCRRNLFSYSNLRICPTSTQALRSTKPL